MILHSKSISVHCISVPFVTLVLSEILKSEKSNLLVVINDQEISERIQSDFTMFSGSAPIELATGDESSESLGKNLAGLFEFYSGKENLYIADYSTIFKNMPTQISLQQTAVIIAQHS
ncbi:MAG: hypothetical protein WAO19_05340, partial [Candidatus Kryptoniota bacterium]